MTALVLASASITSRAAAEPTAGERAIAEGFFQDGRALLAAGHVEEACKKFAASYRVDPAGGTLMNLASCHEREGKLATSWVEFKEALVVAVRANNQVRADEARARVAALEKNLARLSVTASGPPIAGLEVRVDNVPIDADGRSAMPVDPGPHALTASAPGRRTWTGTVVATNGSITPFTLPPLDPAGGAEPAVIAQPLGEIPKPLPPPTSASLAPVDPVVEASYPTWRVPVGATLLGLGGAGLITGIVAGGLAVSAHSSLAAACTGSACPSSQASTLSGYHLKGAVSTAGLVAGGVLAGAGIVVLLATRRSPVESPRVGAFVGQGRGGLEGAF